jgi:hypothetical protein
MHTCFFVIIICTCRIRVLEEGCFVYTWVYVYIYVVLKHCGIVILVYTRHVYAHARTHLKRGDGDALEVAEVRVAHRRPAVVHYYWRI